MESNNTNFGTNGETNENVNEKLKNNPNNNYYVCEQPYSNISLKRMLEPIPRPSADPSIMIAIPK